MGANNRRGAHTAADVFHRHTRTGQDCDVLRAASDAGLGSARGANPGGSALILRETSGDASARLSATSDVGEERLEHQWFQPSDQSWGCRQHPWRCYHARMAVLQVKNLPDDVHLALRRRAAAEGVSLSEYVARALRRDVLLPTVDEWLASLPRNGPDVDVACVLDDVRNEA